MEKGQLGFPGGVKVSLLAWWLVHSADVTWSLSWGSHLPVGPAGPGHSVFWALCDWQDPYCFLFYFYPLLNPTSRVQKAWLVRGRGRQKTCIHIYTKNPQKTARFRDSFCLGSPHSWLLGCSPSVRLGCREILYTAKLKLLVSLVYGFNHKVLNLSALLFKIFCGQNHQILKRLVTSQC